MQLSRLLIGAFLDTISAACGYDQNFSSQGSTVTRDAKAASEPTSGEARKSPIPEGAALTGANLCPTAEDPELSLGSFAFGDLLRRHRLEAGLSQEALAERAQLSTNGIGALERGYRRAPQRQTLVLLVGALALNLEQRQALEAAARHSRLSRCRARVSANVPLRASDVHVLSEERNTETCLPLGAAG
jgi:transcriptional regulator with XRE-family HTH domain